MTAQSAGRKTELARLAKGWLKTVCWKLRNEPSLPTRVTRWVAARLPMPAAASASASPGTSGEPRARQSDTLSKGA
jgi:hypothetical protein